MIKTDLGSECARPIAKCDNVINTYCRTSNSCPFCPNNERCIVGLVCQGSQKTCVATAHNSQFCVRRKNGFVLNFFLYLMNWLRNKFGDKLPARPQSWSDVMCNCQATFFVQLEGLNSVSSYRTYSPWLVTKLNNIFSGQVYSGTFRNRLRWITGDVWNVTHR